MRQRASQDRLKFLGSIGDQKHQPRVLSRLTRQPGAAAGAMMQMVGKGDVASEAGVFRMQLLV